MEEKIFFSQNDEDEIIKYILTTINDSTNYCVEFGAWDGIKGSNSYYFIQNKNFSSVLIEGNKKKHADLVHNMKDYNAVCLCKYVSFDGDNKLDNILAQTDVPQNFSFLSIDIDGNDYHIWESLNNYRPKAVIIEFNPSISNEVDFVQPKNMSLNQGSSALALVRLAKEKGYELVATNINNCFFVDKQYYNLFQIEDNSLHNIRTDLSHVTYIFNGYDGHVFIRGYNKLELYSLPYDEKRMQMIPSFLQGWNLENRLLKALQRIHRSLKKRRFL